MIVNICDKVLYSEPLYNYLLCCNALEYDSNAVKVEKNIKQLEWSLMKLAMQEKIITCATT